MYSVSAHGSAGCSKDGSEQRAWFLLPGGLAHVDPPLERQNCLLLLTRLRRHLQRIFTRTADHPQAARPPRGNPRWPGRTSHGTARLQLARWGVIGKFRVGPVVRRRCGIIEHRSDRNELRMPAFALQQLQRKDTGPRHRDEDFPAFLAERNHAKSVVRWHAVRQ